MRWLARKALKVLKGLKADKVFFINQTEVEKNFTVVSEDLTEEKVVCLSPYGFVNISGKGWTIMDESPDITGVIARYDVPTFEDRGLLQAILDLQNAQ